MKNVLKKENSTFWDIYAYLLKLNEKNILFSSFNLFI